MRERETRTPKAGMKKKERETEEKKEKTRLGRPSKSIDPRLFCMCNSISANLATAGEL